MLLKTGCPICKSPHYDGKHVDGGGPWGYFRCALCGYESYEEIPKCSN